ncbi:MAG TPA: LPS-assembly protein LptD [Gallionellaceae bacterium]|nr:LPS-assembly protein LptD [Gallionellaceae bacterium]
MRSFPSIVLFLAFCALPAFAMGDDEPLQLNLDTTLHPMPHSDEQAPAYVTAERLEGKKGGRLEASGGAELRRAGQAFYADHLIFQQDTREVTADGNVRVEQNGDLISGMHLEYNLDTRIGTITQAEYNLGSGSAHGKADKLRMDGKTNYSFKGVTYTTCPVGREDWMLDMNELDIDRTSEIGVAHGAVIDFKGVPILYSPWMDFPLKGQRKSGLLAPLYGSTSTGGAELTLPIYLNLAPNYDATVAPRFMAKRGTMYNNQFRYMGDSYYGKMEVDTLSDRLTGTRRTHEAYGQAQNLGGGFSDTVDLNRVSDSAYYRDLATTVDATSQVNLPREGVLNYDGKWWNAVTRVQSFQTLQDPLVPVAIPYRRTPQVLITGEHSMYDGTFAFTSEFVDFTHPTAVNGKRLLLYPSISYPLVSDPGYYITPKISVHSVTYRLDQNLAPGQQADVSATIPMFSLDSGMTFERNTQIAGHSLVQTVEPRAYYVYIPYHNQNMLPNFDSELSTFSFTQLFSENRFLGGDRVGDANQVTLATTSRFLDAVDGAELFRATLGERFSFAQPQVNLPIPVATAGVATPAYLPTQTSSVNKSDILAGVTARFSKAVSLDSIAQYNPAGLGFEMYSVSTRYAPEPGKVLNLGYRYTSPVLNPNLDMRQADVSAQWPLYGRWHSVARWNYSMVEKTLLEGLVGLEYNGPCWVARMVVQRFTTSTQQVSTSIFIQLDLTGLAGIGSDPMDALRRSVPGYTKLNQAPAGEGLPGTQ